MARYSTVEQSEREKYRETWAIESYATNAAGEYYAETFAKIVDGIGRGRGTVLDAGCGSGKGSLAIARLGFRVMACDLTGDGRIPEMVASKIPFQEICLWHDLSSLTYMAKVWYGMDADDRSLVFDHAYCTDVLEHIPTPLTMLVIARLLAIVRHGVFLTVSTQPDKFGVWVGKALHQTVQPFGWWRDALGEVGRVEDARDLATNALFYVVRR